ncbi:phage tail assembly chaperone G [Acetobacterium sp.]|uniref:phage tail assembly chaperone G n=1 Tax=Acetobacterium sp. TaxID=1872094 RepID=UPI00271ACCAA|nr:hypothetical protein [Acetobacterium sp.]MDO9492667.1 hypothetical protein [Acetobacterium sp.]
MKIKLGEKTYHTKELMFGDLYKANEFKKYIEDGASKGKDPLSEFDKMAEYLVDLFAGQFTAEDVYKKLPNKGCILKVLELANQVQAESIGQLEIKNDPAVAKEV